MFCGWNFTIPLVVPNQTWKIKNFGGWDHFSRDFTLSLEKQILPKLLLFNGKTLSFLMEYHTILTWCIWVIKQITTSLPDKIKCSTFIFVEQAKLDPTHQADPNPTSIWPSNPTHIECRSDSQIILTHQENGSG